MAADVLEHAHRLGPRGLWRLVPRRLAAAQPACLGPGAGVGGGGLPRVRRARHQPVDGQSRRRLPDQVPEERADGEDLRLGDLPRAAQALRQPHPGDHHRAGPRHGRQCRRDRGRGRARLQEERRATRCAGSISTSASSAASPRRWTSRSATRSARRATATRWRPACSPARPATRPTCSTRRRRTLPVSLEIGDKVLIEGTGAYTATYSSVAFNGFAPLKTYPHLTTASPGAGLQAGSPPQPDRHGSASARLGEMAMITIRQETLRDVAAREALLDQAFGAGRFTKTVRAPARRPRCRPTACRSSRSSDGRVVGTVRLWDVVGRAGRAGAAARAARGRIRDCRSRGIGAALMQPRARAAPAGSAIAPCCWSATRRTTAASASRPRRPARCGCRAATSATGCSRSNSRPARSTARAGSIARRPARARAEARPRRASVAGACRAAIVHAARRRAA